MSKVLLLIDAGNTALKYRLITVGADSFQDWVLFPDSDPEVLKEILFLKADEIWISDVQSGEIPVPINTPIRKIDPSLRFPFKSEPVLLNSLGSDRLCVYAALSEKLDAEACGICITLGTAITYNLMLPGKIAVGGAISPGVKMRFQALHEFTGKLPLVEPDNHPQFPANQTDRAIQAGVILGIKNELEGFIQQVEEDFKVPPEIFLTGGYAHFFENHLKKRNFVFPDLVLRGLYRLAILNRNE